MSLPSLLLFDLGGVLLENTVFENLNRMLPTSLDTAALKDQWLKSSAVRRFELGESAPSEFAVEFISEWKVAISPDAFLSQFAMWPKGLYPGARELLRSLRQEYRVGCLSNSNALHWERFGDFKDDFDIALSSHLLGVIKPDREAFTVALHECGKEPHEVYFFDDSLSNTQAAENLGVRSFHVDGFAALEQVLHREGLV
jgi:glucose-1-phosphatase